MKISMMVAAWVCAGAVAITACSSTPTAVPTVETAPTPKPVASPTRASDAIAVAKAYVETANSGDYDKTLAYYADDAIANTGVGLFIGKDQIAKWLANDVKTTRATPRDWKMDGALVVNTGVVSLARFKQAGIDSVEYRSEYIIDQNGKIRFFAPVVTLTADQQAKLRAAQASSAPQPTPAVDPVAVAKAYVETANTGDFDKTLAFYADDSGALVMNGTLLLTSKSQIANWLNNDVKTTRATPRDWQANGNTVINTGTVSLQRFITLGIGAVEYRSTYVIENGKIRFFYPRVMLTPDQQVKIQAAQPPQATPAP